MIDRSGSPKRSIAASRSIWQVPGSGRPYKLPHGLEDAVSANEAEGPSPAVGSPPESQATPAE